MLRTLGGWLLACFGLLACFDVCPFAIRQPWIHTAALMEPTTFRSKTVNKLLATVKGTYFSL